MDNLEKERGNQINLVENGNFFRKKRHSEILVCEKNFRPPQTRRQVSATATVTQMWLKKHIFFIRAIATMSSPVYGAREDSLYIYRRRAGQVYIGRRFVYTILSYY